MPKLVDHDERRRLIATALLRVAAERGIGAVSLRHVAAEAGVTSGMVQHYFSTKDEMMMFALKIVSENVEARMAAEAEPTSSESAALVRRLLVQLLPFDDQRRIEGQVALAFQAYAATNPPLAQALRANAAQLRAHLTELIRVAQADGVISAHLEPLTTATILLALVEGLGVHVVGEHYGPQEALSVFDAHLATVFGTVDQ
ncbi:MAG: TetR/AcrR family transcriptional regulator [Propionibacteriaceae bacterium]